MLTQSTNTICSSDDYRRLEDSLDILLSVVQLAGGDKLADEERTTLRSALAEFRETAHQMLNEQEFSVDQLRSRKNSGGDDSNELKSLKAAHELAGRQYRGVEELFRMWLKDDELPPDDTRILLRLLKELRATLSRYLSPIRSYSVPPLFSRFLPCEGSRA